jgi:hypothetical protein
LAPAGAWRRAALLGAALAALGLAVEGTRWTFRHEERGLGYAAPSWTTSPLMARIRDLPPEARLYSNGPDAVYLLARRDASELPRPVDPTSRIPRPTYDAEIALMAADRGAFVAFFERIRRPYFPGVKELRARVALVLVQRTPDGALYRIDDPDGG